MTDDERIELASAFLDGEVDPDERALVASDPELLALVEELSSVRDRIAASSLRIDAQERDRNVGAAMADFTGTATGAPPSLTAARARKERRQMSTAVPIGAVAALLVVLIGLGTFLAVRDNGGEELAGDVATAGDSDAAGDAPTAGDQDQAAQLESAEAGGTADAASEADETLSSQEAPAADQDDGQASAAGAAQAETTVAATEETTAEGTPETLATADTIQDAAESTQTSRTPTTVTESGASTQTTAGASLPFRSAAPSHSCDAELRAGLPDRDLGALLVVGPVTPDGRQRLTYEREQGAGAIALEIDPVTCHVISSVAPPPGS
jgi:hypothetical protein